MKYRMFIATFCFLEEFCNGSQYMVSRKSEMPEADHEFVSVHDDANDALENAARVKNELKPLITRVPKTGYRLRTHRALFSNEAAGHAWCANNASQHQGKVVEQSVMEEILSEDDISDMEYKPSFTVHLEVTQVKCIEVEIDSDDFNEVEDEYDAEAKAMELFNDGELDAELDYEAIERQDASVEYTEET